MIWFHAASLSTVKLRFAQETDMRSCGDTSRPKERPKSDKVMGDPFSRSRAYEI